LGFEFVDGRRRGWGTARRRRDPEHGQGDATRQDTPPADSRLETRLGAQHSNILPLRTRGAGTPAATAADLVAITSHERFLAYR
jgi:hypothetical protein